MTTPTEPFPRNSSIPTRADVSLEQPGDLLAAIPHVLGFHPVDSLVIVGLHGKATTSIGLLLRVDLPPPVRYRYLATQLTTPLTEHDTIGVALIVIGGHGYAPEEDLPHRELLTICEEVFTDLGVPVLHQLWSPDTASGAQWRCYEDEDCFGAVPDPASTPLAAVSVASGMVTYNRREDVTATLAPAPDDVLARRADLLAAASAATEPGSADPVALLASIDALIDRFVAGTPALSDQDVVAAATALADPRVRDACLCPRDDEPSDAADPLDRAQTRSSAAERLWIELVRGTPTPERAEPACLLGFYAYLRGDGVLAGIALEHAVNADPGHQLTDLLRTALWTGLPPDALHAAGIQSAIKARHALTPPKSANRTKEGSR